MMNAHGMADNAGHSFDEVSEDEKHFIWQSRDVCNDRCMPKILRMAKSAMYEHFGGGAEINTYRHDTISISHSSAC